MSNLTNRPSSLGSLLEGLEESVPGVKITGIENLNQNSDYCDGVIYRDNEISFHYYATDGSLVFSVTTDILHFVDPIIEFLINKMGYSPIPYRGRGIDGRSTAFEWYEYNRV